jgi:PTH1 family peptidyl-tRNA hydrolase
VKVVVGLGNPGKQYESTRHNVGWMVLDRIADRGGIGGRVKSRDAAAVVIGRVDGLDLVLAKPTTYMTCPVSPSASCSPGSAPRSRTCS